MWRHLVLCTLLFTGCGFGARRVIVMPPPYQPPSWQERQLALRQTWETLVAERSAHERQAALDQTAEAEADAVRQLPAVSLATNGETTLAEAVTVLLTDLSYTVVYGPYVEPARTLTAYISHRRLDRAMATLVHPLGYAVTVDPLQRDIYIEAMATRHWAVSPRPAADTRFWTQLTETLEDLVHDERGVPTAPGYVVVNPEAGDVTVSARVPRMPAIEAHMRPLAVATTGEESFTW
jgi:hypothetical protein